MGAGTYVLLPCWGLPDAFSAGWSHSRYLCCSTLGLPEGPENTVGIVLGWLVFCPEAVWSAGNPSLLFSDIWTAKGQ